ncbi:MAG: replication-associated recombination protein A [Sarcina sp.]
MKPLAEIMRPVSIEDMVGQEHIVSKGKVIRNLLENKTMMNAIFYGPPGTGKTTLANIISKYTDKRFYKINATTASVKDIHSIVNDLDNLINYNGVLLYVDEIQHFNKKQQQSLLEFIEDGRITLIASTTENPYFYIHKAILSRSSIFTFKPLNKKDITIGLEKALIKFKEEGYNIVIEEDVLKYIAEIAQGDIRKAYTVLELAVKSNLKEEKIISLKDIEDLNQSNLKSDGSGDEYYNYLSAFQKSIRGSDPDAAVHYLARLIKGGNLDSIIRRISVIAAEDIGLAYPNALTITNNAIELVLKIGLPEGRIILAELVIYLATLPKSNSAVLAIDKALSDLEKLDVGDVPNHLKDCHYSGAKALGVEGYKYPHNFKNHYIKQQYLPNNIKDKIYYESQENKYESSLKNYWDNIVKK